MTKRQSRALAREADVIAPRLIRLRYTATCSTCAARVEARTEAWWDSDAKTVRCRACGGAVTDLTAAPARLAEVDQRADETSQPSEEPTQPDPGAAGGSARREYQRRHGNREAAIRARHPRLGGLILALSDDPQSTRAWATGAEGERRVALAFEAAGIVALHDRRIPRSQANIDHIAISPSGVFVVDAKRYAGLVRKRDVGG
ncbi:MAG TPA: nuclease-related domain-containing protein, partial [Jatrophihabitantaceae bacterium]|nr:nuclease-related domain-containing protein [Jatrophihabitantaceae bacterium]